MIKSSKGKCLIISMLYLSQGKVYVITKPKKKNAAVRSSSHFQADQA